MYLRPIKVLSALVLSLCVAFTAAADEDTFTVNGINYTITDADNVKVSPSDDLYSGDITIPATVKYSGHTYNVTCIDYYAFSNCSELLSVNLPEGITTIGCNAFERCSSLKSINIPTSVTRIMDYCFWYCTDLKEIDLPSSMTCIDRGTFSECFSLERIGIPESITEISSNVFYNCWALGEITLPENLTSIDYYTFSKCYSLTSITLPSKLTFINVGLFEDCDALRTVTCLVENPAQIVIYGDIFEHLDRANITLRVPSGSVNLYRSASAWDGCNIKAIAEKVDLVDATTYDNDRDIDCADITYTRNFKNTNWQPLYVPYNMAYEEWCNDAEVAKLYNIRGYDKNGDGEIDDVTIEFSRVNTGEIYPNVPYIIRAKNEGEVTFVGEDKTLLAKPDEESYIECSSTKFVYGFYGIYDTKTDMYSTGAYTLTGGTFSHVSSDKVTLKPYRFYMMITPKSGGYNSSTGPMPQKIKIMVDGEETTAIDDIIIDTPAEGALYDLMGRKVQNPAAGIYIRDGKKVMIK